MAEKVIDQPATEMKLVKIGARVIRYARAFTFQLTEVAVTSPMVRSPRRHLPIKSVPIMCITTIYAQTRRKRQDRSARCAEKHYRRVRTSRLRGLICPVLVFAT